MNPLPRQAVFGAAAALVGASLLGLYVGVHDSLDRPIGQPVASAGSVGGAVALQPGMVNAITAQPLKPDQLAPSSAPAQVTQVAKHKETDEDAEAADNEDVLS